MKRNLLIILTFSLLIASGVLLGQSHSVNDDNGSIEEEVYGVQLVIKGKVERLGDRFKRKSGGITKFGEDVYDVTPATINVQKVIYGASPSSPKITL